MARIVFYEKPGCRTNANQRRLLQAAGHQVITRDLLSEPWTPERLREFFADTAVAQWFNRAAPRVKSGEVDPAALEPAAALDLMVRDRLLIRRPLLEIGALRIAGFDPRQLQANVQLAPDSGADRLQDCSRLAE
jgi:nitrogenase-associated protein